MQELDYDWSVAKSQQLAVNDQRLYHFSQLII